ncbi:MAG TPA: LytR C-terminal domain-containing protein, partial [Pyrinomonadaceae bacterium]
MKTSRRIMKVLLRPFALVAAGCAAVFIFGELTEVWARVGGGGSYSGGGSSGGSGGAAKSSPKDPKANKPASAPIRPADVSVAVLNATPVAGLASQFGDRAQGLGFKKDNVGNYRGAQRAESVVMYAPGRKAEAKFVSKKFNINNIEPVDPTVQADAPQADVIV